MEIEIDLRQYPDTAYSHELPPPYEGLQLPYAKTLFISGAFGDFISQEIAGENYSISFFQGFIKKPVHIHYQPTEIEVAFHFMLKGEVDLSLIGIPSSKKILEDTYQLLIFPPVKDVVQFLPGKYNSVHLNLQPAIMSTVASKHPHLKEAWQKMKNGKKESILQPAVPITPHIRNLLDKILWCELGPGKRDLYIQSKLSEIILLYIIEMELLDDKEKIMDNRYEQMTQKALFYITENLDGPLTVPMIAQEVGVMPNTLERAFKKVHQQSVGIFIQEQRMNRAKELLVDTKFSIADIAYMVGFTDPTYFSVVFKKHFTVPPSAFRKAI